MKNNLRSLYLTFVTLLVAIYTAHASNDGDWWSMGPVGGKFQVQSGSSYLKVQTAEAGGPADLAGLQVGDYILGAFGKQFGITNGSSNGYKGATQDFGDAIERAESSDGVLPLLIMRSGTGSVNLTVNLPVTGAFGPSYPLGSAKFDTMYQKAAADIHAEIAGNANADAGYMSGFYGMILLADPNWNETTGTKPYRLSIDRMRDRAVEVLNAAIVNPVEATNLDGTPNDGSENDSDPNDQSYVGVGLENWGLSTWSMFLAEYRSKTGDTSVDATIQRAADLLAGRIQTWQQPPYGGSNGPTKVGLMGHGGVTGDYPHIGYAGINIVNAHAMTALAMLKTAGATVDDTKMQASWNWVKGTTRLDGGSEDGNIGYAWKQGGGDSSGRTAGVAFSMSSYGGLDAVDQGVLDRMKDYVVRQWQRFQHAHAYTVAGTQFYQFVLPYLNDREQRFIMANQRHYYHFHRTTSNQLVYFGGRENNGGDGYVGTYRVALANIGMAQAVASGNLTTIPNIDTARIHADFTSPYLTWPSLDARHAEIGNLSQAFTVDITDYLGNALLPANYTATWSHVSGPATATFTSTNTAGTTVNFPQDGTYRIQLEVVSNGYTLIEPIDVVVDTSGGPAPVAPSIVTQPSPQTTTLGGAATFTVTVDGDGPFLYEWFYGAVSLGASPSSSLNLTNVSGGQAGDYHCVITHPAGTLTSATASLTIPDAGVLVQGGLWRDQFDGISGNSVSDLTSNSKFPRQPSFAEVLDRAESDREIGDNYGSRWTGWITPDVTGDYVFYLASDYSSELWISTDSQPSNKVLVTSNVNVLSRNWDGGGQSAAISLTAGQAYYIEVLHKENTGSDYCGVAWQKPGEAVPVDGSEPIPGQYFSYFSGGVHGTTVTLPPVFDSSSYAWNLDENTSTGTSLGIVSASDADTPITYAITEGNTNGVFAIDSSTGEITLANALDYETSPSYTLTIQATNASGLIGQVQGVVTVNDIYDAQFIVDTNFESVDGFTGYSGHATLATTTDNLGNEWSTPNDARIWNSSNIPPSGTQCLVLGVAGNPSTAELVIPDTDHGVSSVTFDYASFSTSTNVTLTLSYRVDGGAWVQVWSTSVVGMTPNWQLKPWPFVNVDINQTGDVDLKLETSGNNGVLVDTFKVKDNRPNLPPVANDSTMSVSEGVSVGTSVGTIDASDPNTGDPLSFAITAGNAGGVFAINSTTGEITVSGTLDYDVLNLYSLTVQVTDSLGLSDTATVTINITEIITDLIAVSDSVSVQADTTSTAYAVLSNDSIPTGQTGSVLGFYNSVAHYDAGVSGAPADPTSVDGGSWTGSETEDGDYTSGNVTGLPSINDNGSGLDAWVVTDNTAGGGQWITYTKTPSAAELALANANGWIFETKMRFIDDFGAGVSTVLIYGNGSKRFLVFFELNASGDLVAQTFGTGGATYTLTTGGTGSQDFHDIQMVYDPSTSTASFVVDGVRYDGGNWSGQGNGFTGVQWGNGSSGGKGSAAFHQVKWGYLDQTATLASGATASFANGDVTFNPNGGYAYLGAGDTVEEALTYAITGGIGNTSTGSVFVTVQGVNDAPVVDDTSGSLAEDVSVGAAVATMTSSDVDMADTISYAITAGNTGDAFTIDANSGAITTAAALDFETTANYTLSVTGTDSGGLSDTATVTVTVTDSNEAPVANDASGSVAENTAAGAGVTTVTATDPDAGDIVNFAIIAGNTGGAFVIDANTGAITTTAPLNHESVSQYNLTVTATDSGGLSDTATVIVTVTNVNEAPSAATAAGSVAENSAAGTSVATVLATDPDAGDTLSFAITAGNTGGVFAINANTGLITAAAGLDYESASQYVLTVTVTDDGGLSDVSSVTVDVTDVNEAPVANDASGSVAEDAPVGTLVATVGSSDPDTGDSVSFAITAGNTGGAFAINSTTGEITTATSLDYQTTSSYSLTVTVTDGGGLTDTALVNVAVTNVNDSPIFANDPITGANGVIFSAYSGSISGEATDPDTGDTLTYSKVSGPAWLIVAADGSLSGTPTATDAGLNVFTVEVSDGKGGTAQATLNITLNSSGTVYLENFQSYDVENPSDFSVAGAPTGNWTASNSGANATRIFNTGNYGGTRLWISNVDGTSITSAGIPLGSNANYTMSAVLLTETATAGRTLNARYDILVGQTAATAVSIIGGPQAVVTNGDDWQVADSKTDHVFTHSFQTEYLNAGDQLFVRYERVGVLVTGGWFGVDDIQIDLLGLNAAPVAGDGTFSVDENAAPGTVVGSVSATDPDVADTLTYSISAGNAGGEFVIDSATGQISTTTALDFESTSQYVMTVEVSDGRLTDSANVTINVSDLNEAPVAVDTNVSIAEDTSAGSSVTTVSSTDQDVGDSVSYSITAGNDGSFAINSTSGEITLATMVDYETTSSYVLTVTATDAGGLTGTATVNVTVTDVVFEDYDSDSLDDNWEIANFGDTISTDGTGDTDNDGLTDGEEYLAGSDPNSSDGDTDGFHDVLELKVGTDPLDNLDFPDSSYAGLEGWWSLDESTGATIALDNSGNALHAQVSEAVFSGAEASFDGVDDYITTDPGLMNNLSAFTMSGWYRSGLTNGSRIGLWGQNDVVEFGINGNSLRVWTAGGGSASASIPTVNQWHHVVVVGDGSSLKIYIDGVLAGTGGNNATNYGSSASSFNIGGGGVWDASGNAFTGDIKDVRVYYRAVDISEFYPVAPAQTSINVGKASDVVAQTPALGKVRGVRLCTASDDDCGKANKGL
ncbi:cadherin domain-containing protein [Rubritalea halochordaticola]